MNPEQMNPDQKVSELQLPHTIPVNRGGIKELIIKSARDEAGRPLPYHKKDFMVAFVTADQTFKEAENVSGDQTIGEILAKILPKKVDQTLSSIKDI